MIFRRDPALWLSLLATILRLISAFWLHLSVDQQALLNTLLAAIIGVAVAMLVKHDGQVAAITGFFAALIAAAVGFRFNLSAENQALIMSFVGIVLAFIVRTQVVAAVPATTNPTTVPAPAPVR